MTVDKTLWDPWAGKRRAKEEKDFRPKRGPLQNPAVPSHIQSFINDAVRHYLKPGSYREMDRLHPRGGESPEHLSGKARKAQEILSEGGHFYDECILINGKRCDILQVWPLLKRWEYPKSETPGLLEQKRKDSLGLEMGIIE